MTDATAALQAAMQRAVQQQEQGYAPAYTLEEGEQISGTVETVDWRDRTDKNGQPVVDRSGKIIRYPIVTVLTAQLSHTNQRGEMTTGTRWAVHLSGKIGTDNFLKEVANGGVVADDLIAVTRTPDRENPNGSAPMRCYAIAVVRHDGPRHGDGSDPGAAPDEPAAAAPQQTPTVPAPTQVSAPVVTSAAPPAAAAPQHAPAPTATGSQVVFINGKQYVQNPDGSLYEIQGAQPPQAQAQQFSSEPF